MKEFSIEEIKSVILIRKGYRLFYGSRFDLNVGAIRADESKSDAFDDIFYVMYQDEFYCWQLELFKCTTDPGKHWLLNPLNRKGTLIAIPNQYRSSHKLGFHNRRKGPEGMYAALEQVGDMDYVRDNNKDSKLDFSLMKNVKNWIKGNFKTNIHRASRWKRLFRVGMYSAGCTVLQEDRDLARLISLVKSQSAHGLGDTISYTLLEEKDFYEPKR